MQYCKIEHQQWGIRIYTDPVRLTATGDITFNPTMASVFGSTVQMTSIVVRLYDVNDGNPEGTLIV